MPYVFEGLVAARRVALTPWTPIRPFQQAYNTFLNRTGLQRHFSENDFPTNIPVTGGWDDTTASAFLALMGEYSTDNMGYMFGRNLAQAWLNFVAGIPLTTDTWGQSWAVNRFQRRLNLLLVISGAAMQSLGYVTLTSSGQFDAPTREAFVKLLGGNENQVTALMRSFLNFDARRG